MDAKTEAAYREIHQQANRKAGGYFGVAIFRPEHKSLLLQNHELSHYRQLIESWLGAVRSGRQKPLCLACDHEWAIGRWEEPGAFCIAMPYYDGATMGMVTGVCQRCSEKGDDELEAIYYRGVKEFGMVDRMPSQEEQHQIMARRREQEIVVDAGTAWSAKVAASMPIARRHAGLGLVNG
jgi:hypothetical protein